MRSLLSVVVLIGCLSRNQLTIGSDYFDLSRKNLTYVSTIPTDNDTISTDYIDLSYNNITTIDPSSFKKFKEMDRLNLDGNKWLNFPSNANPLIYQDSLTDFSCFRCGVDKIYNRSLAGIPRLEQINLTDNKIAQIEGGAFQGNLKLKLINLRRNSLQRVPREMVAYLEEIIKVDLSFNHKLAAEGDLPFLVSNVLQELWCIECGFEIVHERTFVELFNLKFLHLQSNKITQVHARAFFQVSLDRSLLVSLEHNKLQRIDSDVKVGLMLCLHNNTIDLECFLRDIPDKDSFVCANSTDPETECIPPTTESTTILTTESSEKSYISNTIVSTNPVITDSKQAANNPTTSSTSTTTTPLNPPEEVYGISDAYISGYLTLIYVAQIVALALLSVVWLRLKKSDPEVDRYAEGIVNPSPNYRAIQ